MVSIRWIMMIVVGIAGGTALALPRMPITSSFHGAFRLMPAEDPFAIQRLRVREAQLPDLLKELEPGPTVRLPRDEFESRVQAAGRAVARKKQCGRLIDAVYSARYEDDVLNGSAELAILNPHRVAGFMPLDPLRLAIRDAKWDGGSDAILAVTHGAGVPAVWIDRNEKQTLNFTWSLAGTTEPGARRFDLRVPHCLSTMIELNLPEADTPAVSTDVLLTGPFEIPEQPTRKLWRLRTGGRTRVEVLLLAADSTGGFARAKMSGQYDFVPGQLTTTIEYELAVSRGATREWLFIADPGLRITDVSTNNQARWVVDPPESPDGPSRIRVQLRHPTTGGKVLISAVAPFPATRGINDNQLPVVRPHNAVIEAEVMDFRLAQGLKVESWSLGDYRLTNAFWLPGLPLSSDSVRVLQATGTLTSPAPKQSFRRMPTIKLAPLEAEFSTEERLKWELDPAGARLGVHVAIHVRRGPVFQLGLRVPPGMVLNRTNAAPEDWIAHVGQPVAGVQVVEFSRPLQTGQQIELQLEFNGAGGSENEPIPFPAFGVAGAWERKGWLSIHTTSRWVADVRAGVGAEPLGLWRRIFRNTSPGERAVYHYRGREPEGTVSLTRASPSITANALVTLDNRGDRWLASTRFEIEVSEGSVQTIVAALPATSDSRSWRVIDNSNTIVDIINLPGELMSLDPGLAQLAPGQTVWLLRFARPIKGTVILETTSTDSRKSDTGTTLPIPRFFGATQAATANLVPSVQHRFTVEVANDQVIVRPRPLPTSLAIADAYLVTSIQSPEHVVAVFGGKVLDSQGSVLNLKLPDRSLVRGIWVEGRWQSPVSAAAVNVHGELPVMIPVGTNIRFEVCYQLPVEPRWLLQKVSSPVPTVSGDQPSVARWWHFAEGYRLASFGSRGQSDATVQLLSGNLDIYGPGQLLSESAEQHVIWYGSTRTADAITAIVASIVCCVLLFTALRRRASTAIVFGLIVVLALFVSEVAPAFWARIAMPLLVVAIISLAVVLVNLTSARRETVQALLVGSLFASWVATPALHAQVNDSATVFIISDEQGNEEVVASRGLLERLEQLSRPSLPPAVLVDAAYKVRADQHTGHVHATLSVYAFSNNENTLIVPLGDARLESVRVGGKRAFPTTFRPDAYSIALPGPGRHEVELSFAISITATGSDRELRFVIPESPSARLSAKFPDGARQVQLLSHIGSASKASADATELQAELGPAKSVHLRWRESTGGATVVKVREGCVWDLSESGATLSAAYLLRIEQGTLPSMRLELPDDVVVTRVATRNLDTPAPPITLRDWSVSDDKQIPELLVAFQNPATGRLLVIVECIARQPLSRQALLRFPRIKPGTLAGETDSVYGLRTTTVAIENVQLGGVIDFPPEALKDFTAIPDLRMDPNNPGRAFRPVQGGSPELRLNLRVGDPISIQSNTTWHVGPQRADAAGRVAWSAKEPVAFFELNLPTIRVSEIRGQGVLSWNQTGARVQIWLRTPVREGSVEWHGSLSPVLPGKAAMDIIPFDPVYPRVVNSRSIADEVRVRTIDGWTLQTERARGWNVLLATPHEMIFRTEVPTGAPLRMQLRKSVGP